MLQCISHAAGMYVFSYCSVLYPLRQESEYYCTFVLILLYTRDKSLESLATSREVAHTHRGELATFHASSCYCYCVRPDTIAMYL